jgi:hypothetical protein
MIRRIRSAPAPFSSIEPWHAKRRFEEDWAERRAPSISALRRRGRCCCTSIG